MTTTPHTLHNERYRIEKVLGAGGMSLVFLAQDTRLGVQRAIKLLRRPYARSENIRTRFLGEAFAQADLRHPNILMVHDVVEDEESGSIFLVMELADGGSLADRVMTERPLSPRAAAEVGITIGNALGVAHAAGVIHRDIKPGNILVDRHGVLKLADFGIAQIQSREQITRTGVSIGTWSFMPPEQRIDARDADSRADIYALGGSLFYLMTGKNPDALHNRETHAVAFATIPPQLSSIIQRATRFEPTDRYQSCEEMVAALEGILDAMGDQPVVNLKPAPRPPQLSIDEVLSSYYTEGPAFPARADQPGGLPSSGTVVPHPDDLESLEERATSQPSPVNPTIAPPLPPPQPAGRSVLQATLAGLVAAVATVGLLAWLILPQLPQQPAATLVPPAPEAEPVATLTPPAVAVAATPEPIEPAPPSPRGQPSRSTGPRIISVLPGSAASGITTESAPVSAPVLSTTPTPATGTLLLRTIPSGAKVSEAGEPLLESIGGHTLTAGTHLLEVESSTGENTLIPVTISAGKTLEICYNFDTNSACVN